MKLSLALLVACGLFAPIISAMEEKSSKKKARIIKTQDGSVEIPFCLKCYFPRFFEGNEKTHYANFFSSKTLTTFKEIAEHKKKLQDFAQPCLNSVLYHHIAKLSIHELFSFANLACHVQNEHFVHLSYKCIGEIIKAATANQHLFELLKPYLYALGNNYAAQNLYLQDLSFKFHSDYQEYRKLGGGCILALGPRQHSYLDDPDLVIIEKRGTLSKNNPPKKFEHRFKDIEEARLSPYGTYTGLCTDEGIEVWNIKHAIPHRLLTIPLKLSFPHYYAIADNSMVFLSDNTTREISYFNCEQGRSKKQFLFMPDESLNIRKVACSSDGKILANEYYHQVQTSKDNPYKILLYDLETSKETGKLSASFFDDYYLHPEGIMMLTLSHDEGEKKEIKLWDMRHLEYPALSICDLEEYDLITIHHDSRIMAGVTNRLYSSSNTVSMWDGTSGKKIWSNHTSLKKPYRISFNDSGTKVVLASSTEWIIFHFTGDPYGQPGAEKKKEIQPTTIAEYAVLASRLDELSITACPPALREAYTKIQVKKIADGNDS
jgi:hypothetical protein